MLIDIEVLNSKSGTNELAKTKAAMNANKVMNSNVQSESELEYNQFSRSIECAFPSKQECQNAMLVAVVL